MAVHKPPVQFLVMPKKNRKRRQATKDLPNKIRKWRERAGFTLEDAAAEIGQTFGNLSAMERGAQGYSRETLEALAKLYGAKEPGYLLSVDPENDIYPLWENSTEDERAQIVAIAKALKGIP